MKVSNQLVGWYQIASAGGFLLVLATNATTIDTFSIAILALLAGLNLIAGIGLTKYIRWATRLSLGNMIAQIPQLNAESFTYGYSGVGDLFLFAKIDPASGTFFFGPYLQFSPGSFFFGFVGVVQGFELYVGVLAAVFSSFLARSLSSNSLPQNSNA